MNERIRQLAEQSMVSISYRVCQNTFKEIDDSAGPFVRKEFSKEKFAELIVRECVDVVSEIPVIDHGHPHPAWKIKQHFGIES